MALIANQPERLYYAAVIWWAKKARVKQQLCWAASNMGNGAQYGMVTATNIDAEYDNTVEDFAAAHTAHQVTMVNISAGIPSIQ